MGRGKGVRLQKYKDGGLSDATTFAIQEGLAWKDPAGRTRTVEQAELLEWIGKRAAALANGLLTDSRRTTNSAKLPLWFSNIPAGDSDIGVIYWRLRFTNTSCFLFRSVIRRPRC